ncbi:MAG: GYF domain-containing protein [Candidatus Hydrogenedentota bacterium]
MRQYYLYLEEQNKGPYSIDEVESLILTGEVKSDSYIWYDGLSDWCSISSLDEFSEYFIDQPQSHPIHPQEKRYFVKIKEQQIGPFTEAEIKKIELPKHAKFTEAGSNDWKPISLITGAKNDDDEKEEEEKTKENGSRLTRGQKIVALVSIGLILAVGLASLFIVKYFTGKKEKPADLTIDVTH